MALKCNWANIERSVIADLKKKKNNPLILTFLKNQNKIKIREDNNGLYFLQTLIV